jgi:D-alanine-D-alanine ligase
MTRGELAVLLALGLLPLMSAALRVLALPGILGPGLSGTLLPSIGHELSQFLSLQSIPPGDRGRILYLLFLPTGAILIALARLTFGLRLIGFRSILISVGFQQSGIGPSLLLIAAMVTVVIAIRPALVRFRLAYFPRVAVIMSVSVLLLLCVLLIAPWANSDDLWGVAFFPVLVLGLMAEGIAKTIDRESTLSALSRTLTTIFIALVLALISHITLLREIAIEFPELVVTQIISIILIAEFLDLRLLQDLDAKLSGIELPRLFSRSGVLHIAVVRNRRNSGVIGQLGPRSRGGYRRRSVREIADSLRNSGHAVEVFEGDMTLLSRLQAFMPPDPRTQQPGGIVLNLSHGIQGDGPAAHVPAMLEMAGLPYTGPTPRGLVITMDRVATKALLLVAGISTPDCWVYGGSHDEYRGLTYPAVIKPRVAQGYSLRIAQDRQQLDDALRLANRECRYGVVVESYVEGRAFDVAVLGNDAADCLPLVEILPNGKGSVCPAQVGRALERSVCSAALGAFRACACRDYALVSVRLSPSGEPLVMDIEVDGILEKGESFAVAAEAAGLPYDALLDRIIQVARRRYRPEADVAGVPALPASGGAAINNGGAIVAR